MKKKIIPVAIGIILVLSLLSGRSGSDNNGKKTGEEAAQVNTPETAVQESAERSFADTEEVKAEALTQAESAEKENSGDADTEDENDESSEEVTPGFKEAMDSYEEFFDEYVEFMKKYSDSDDALGMLSDYSNYMIKYADMIEKMDKIDTEELSAPDYAYYIEVTARIQKKLLEIS